MKILLMRLVALASSVCILLSTVLTVANAAMVGTETAISIEQHVQRIDEISRWLMQDEVAAQLADLGVDADQARKRVAMMTDTELQQLQGQIHHLPAGGGVLEVIGIVFVVLIILELLGVTNVFSRM